MSAVEDLSSSSSLLSSNCLNFIIGDVDDAIIMHIVEALFDDETEAHKNPFLLKFR